MADTKALTTHEIREIMDWIGRLRPHELEAMLWTLDTGVLSPEHMVVVLRMSYHRFRFARATNCPWRTFRDRCRAELIYRGEEPGRISSLFAGLF